MCRISGAVKSIHVIGLLGILKAHSAAEIPEEQLALFWAHVSNKGDFVLCWGMPHKISQSIPLCHSGSWWFYSDSLRKLNPPQRIRPKHSASVSKASGCALPQWLLWNPAVRMGLEHSWMSTHSSPLQQLFRELGRSFKSPQNHLFFSLQSLECVLQ